MLHRTQEGRHRAGLPGRLRRARSPRGADLLLEMDSDFSHDPADLPRLIAAAADADLVLGSRYVPGGGVTDWGLGRRADQPRRLALRPADPAASRCAT